jgi:hypothetical protein
MEDMVSICLSGGLQKVYNLRPTGSRGTTVETSIPREPLEREARQRGLSVGEFVERFQAVWHFNDFGGLFLTFREKRDPGKGPGENA